MSSDILNQILDREEQTVTETTSPLLHVRYDGRSFDLPLSELDVGALSTDAQIKSAVANHLNFPVSKLAHFVVDRNQETGALTLRPEAVFG